MPMIYATWHGGSGYTPSSVHEPEHLETFPSIEAAKDALRARERHGYWSPQEFNLANGDVRSVLTPCVEQSSMDLYFYDPREAHDPYPDRRISIGPRGGVREEST